MTYGELFREVSKKLHGTINEEHCRYADSVAPQLINVEVPADRLEQLRADILEQARAIHSLPLEEKQRILEAHIGRN